jgi:DNA repair exonuclease SbcCD nuclease subunit
MKVLHLADTHIGYSAYNRLDENGYNQREMDVYDAFRQVIDYALKHKPDLVVHAGDLFDSVRPSNRAISFVIEQLLRLSDADIPTVMISGNHSTPRLRETGSVFKLFEHIDNVHLAYTGKYQTFDIGDLVVHALPHCVDKEVFDTEIAKMMPAKKSKFNIAVLHVGVVGLSVFKMNEFNEQLATSKSLEKGFGYVALGHYHEHVEVSDSAVYAGSTERFGFGEVGQPKGFVWLDLEKGEWKYNKLKVRKMLDLKAIDCRKRGSDEISKAIRDNLDRAELKGAIVRQKLVNVSRQEHNLLDVVRVRKWVSEALHFELRAEMKDAEHKVATSAATFDTLEKEFVSYLSKVSLEGLDRKAIRAKGLEYLKTSGGEE